MDATLAAELLGQPFQLRGLTLKNRIVMPPMVTNFAGADGVVGDRSIRYYATRAGGGVGTVVVEAAHVAADGRAFAFGVGICDDRHIPGLRALVDALHSGGALAGIQLLHGGRRSRPDLIGSQPVGPSPIATTTGVIPRALDAAEVRALVEAYGRAAARAVAAGFDMLELHAAHGYLLNQFLSPLSNHREDEYGGSFDNRLRFPLAVVAEVRRQVGSDFPIVVRMPGDEFVSGGLTLADTPEIARRFVAAGVDAIDVSGGIPESPDASSSGLRRHPAQTPKGFFLPLAAAIKAAVSVPVEAVCRLNDPLVAAQVLADRKADLIGVGRGILVDPEWPKKALDGAGDTIRNCTYCSGCNRLAQLQASIFCKRNKSLGQEYLL